MIADTVRTVILAVLLALATPAAAQDSASYTPVVPVLKAAATVSSDIVRIGDLVANAGVVADVAIFRAPDLGSTGMVPTARVLDAIRPHHLIGINTLNIGEVAVTRVSRSIVAKEIEVHIARFFAGQYGLGKPENIAVIFDRDLRTVHLDPSTTGELAVARAAYDQRSGRFDVVFDLPGNAGSRAPLRYSGRLFEAMEVAILERPVARGEVIKAADISVERKPKAEASDASPAEATIGLAARQALRAGQVLRRADLMKPELVQRNDTVTIIYEVPGILLTMRGKALDGGAEGDAISVLNMQSKRTLQGTVSGPGRVTIAASMPPVATSIAASAATPTAMIETTAATRRRTQ
jgi:flagella basal body P-ring formation protein FlgA